MCQKTQTLIALIPLIVSVVLLMNPLNGILFKIDQNENFQEGPFYLLYVFINDLYFMIGAY